MLAPNVQRSLCETARMLKYDELAVGSRLRERSIPGLRCVDIHLWRRGEFSWRGGGMYLLLGWAGWGGMGEVYWGEVLLPLWLILKQAKPRRQRRRDPKNSISISIIVKCYPRHAYFFTRSSKHEVFGRISRYILCRYATKHILIDTRNLIDDDEGEVCVRELIPLPGSISSLRRSDDDVRKILISS